MPYYMIQAAYTNEACANLVTNPADRTEAVRQAVEKLGGTLESLWYSFGEYDVVGIITMPDSVSTAAFSMAVKAGGALTAGKTTQLFTIAEGLEAMRKAAAAGYQPPGN